MRRLSHLKQKSHGERGAISVIVAILLAALLGFGAMAVDVSMMFAERTQLRNGADSAALAVAQTCAKYPSSTDCSSPLSLAAGLANGNASDKLSNVKAIAVDVPNRVVTATVGAQETGHSANEVSLFFARVLGMNTAEITASSTARWGTPSKGPVILPLVIARCKLNVVPGALTGAVQVLDQSFSGCAGIPGGFGWIPISGTQCTLTVTAGASDNAGLWFNVDPGASAPTGCVATDFAKLNDQTVLLPLYDVATGTGSGGKYFVSGFAAFHITGYHFANFNWSTGGAIQNKTIRGYFVKYVSLAQAFELGETPDYGANIVRLNP